MFREIALRISAAILALFSLFGFNTQALAASQVWTPTGATANWSDSTNWGGNPAPGSTTVINSTDVATFNTAVGTFGTAGSPIIIDQPAQNIDGISFDTNAGNFVIGTTTGNPLLLTSGGTIQILSTLLSTNAIETINAPLVIEGTAYTITNNSFNGTGATDGTLLIGGAITSSTLSAVLTLSGSNTNANVVSGVISNSGTNTMGVTKTGVGLWVLSGDNTYTGTTTVTTGTLDAGVASVPGVSGAFGLNGPVTLANTAGVALNLNGFNTQIGSLAGGGTTGGTLLLGANTLTLGGTTTTTFAGTVTGAGNIVRAGTGRETLSGSNNYTGTTTVTSGTLEFAAESSLYSDGTSSWIGSKIITQAGGTLGLVVSGSSPQFTPADVAAFLAGMDTTSSATSGFENGSSFGIDTANATNGVFTYSNTISNAYAGGNLGLSKLGANTLVLAGTDTYTGPTLVTAGTLEFATESSLYNDATASWNGNNIIVLSGGTLALSVGAAPNFTASDLSTLLTNMATTSATNSGFETGSILALDTTNASGGAFAYSGVIANGYAGGTLGFNKLGPGTLTLSGPSTYTGATTITSGTLQAGIASVANVSGAFGLDSAVTLANSPGVTLNITGFNTQIGSLAGSGTSGANVILGSNTLTISGTAPGASNTFAGPISGTGGSLVVTGSGTEILSGTDTYTGTTTVSGGALEFATEAALYNDTPSSWNGANIIVQSGTFALAAGAAQFNTTDVGTFLSQMDATSSATSGLESGATLGFDTGAAAGATFVIANPLTNTYAGGTLNLAKLGAGTLVLTGSNSYSGTTTIGGGTLEFLNENALYGNVQSSWTPANIIVQNGGALAVAVGASPQFNSTDLGTLLTNLYAGSSPTSGFENGSTLALNTTYATGGTFTYGNLIANPYTGGAMGFTKLGPGTLVLNGTAANTYTGATTIDAGTLLENFSNLAAPVNLISGSSALTMAGASLTIQGGASGPPTQSFASTALSGGNSILSVSGTSTLNLGAITYNAGATLEFNGPVYNNAPTTTTGQATSGLVPATGVITTTSGASNGLVVSNAAGNANDNAYATVGLYDFALTSGTGGAFSVVGASQGTGGTAGDGAYLVDNAGNLTAGTAFTDVIGVAGTHNTTSVGAVRYNAPGAGGLTVSSVTSLEGVLVTPNVGANNITITTLNEVEPGQRSATVPGSMSLIQNDTSGYIIISGLLVDGKTAGGSIVQTGAGTVDYTSAAAGGYTGQTYLDGGVAEIVGDGSLGNAATGAAINLNGGTILSSTTMALDNGAGVNARPITLLNNGGGLAAATGAKLTVDGLIGSGAASGPLVIGIPASSANSNTVGLVPGTGAGTANGTALYGTGTVILTGANYYNGGTTLVSGTLNINGINTLGGADYGGITFSGGALQYATAFSGNGSGDLTPAGTPGVTIGAAGGTIDTNGNSVTYANPIAGTGNLSVASSAAGGSLTLTGVNTGAGSVSLLSGGLTLAGTSTYTGATAVSGGNLTLAGGASLANTAITVTNAESLLVHGNATIGTTGASISILGNSILSMQDNAIETLTLNGISGTALGVGGALSPANFDFDINNTSSDELVINNGVTTFRADGGKIFVDDLNNLNPMLSYTLISDPAGGLAVGTGQGAYFTLGNTAISVNGNTYALSLANSTSTAIILTLASTSVNFYWTGNASSSWATAGNFATDHTGAVNQTNSLIASSNVFLTDDSPTVANTTSQTLDGNYTINSLSFTGTGTGAGSNSITLANGSGTALTIVGSNAFGDAIGGNYPAGVGLVVQPGSAAHTISANIDLGSSQTWQVNNSSANPLTISGIITNAAGTTNDSLTKSGSGTMIFTSANTYNGGTIVSGGTLMLGPGGALSAGSALTVKGTGTFDLGSNSLTIGSLSDGGASTGTITASTGPATLTIVNTTPSTFGGMITDTSSTGGAGVLALSLQGSSSVTLSGSSSFTGGTTLVGGNLTIANNYALGSGTAVGLNVVNTGAVTIFFTSANPQAAAIIDNNVTTTGLDTFILGNTSGAGSATTLNIGGNGNSSVIDGTIGDLSGSLAAAKGNLAIVGGGFVTLGGANTFTGTTTVSGSGSQGISELVLSNALALQDSILVYNDTDAVDAPAVSFGSLAGVTLAGLQGVGNLPFTATITISGTNSTTFLGNLSGAGSLTLNTTGTVQIGSGAAGGALYGGGTTINSGTLILGGTTNSTGSITLTGENAICNLVVQDNAVINSASALLLDTGNGQGYPSSNTVTVTGTATLDVAGVSFGNGGARVPTNTFLTVSGLGTVIDSGSTNLINTDGGTGTQAGVTLNLNGGTYATDNFILTNYGGNAASAAFIDFNGGTLEALANDPSGSTFLPALARLTANVLGGGAVINTNGFNITIAQPLVSGTANDGGLTKTGAGTLFLAGANTYVGATKINGGLLNLASATAIPPASALTFGGGTLQYTSVNTTDYSARVVNSTGPVSIGVNGQSITFASPLAASNTGGLSVQDAVPGVGSLTLTSTNNYSGPTTINSGAILVLGHNGGLPNTAVTNNGTLLAVTGNAGIGAGSASLNLGAGSTLSLVDGAAGLLNVNGSLTIGGAASATIDLELNTDTLTNDTINVSGPITYGAAGGVIDFTDLGGTTAPANNTQFTIIKDTNGGLGTNSLTLAQLTLFIDGQSYLLSLANSNADNEIVTLTTASLSYFWTGNSNSSWATFNNFAANSNGLQARSVAPAPTNSVFLTATSAANFAQTLDGNYSINSLNFTGAGTSAGSNSITLSNGTGSGLTIVAANSYSDQNGGKYLIGTGLVVQAGAAADTISANINLANSQTWEIDSSNPLTVTGVIADGSTLDSLTKTGTGTLILSNAETYDGGTIVNNGTLALGPGGSLSTSGTLTVSGTGTFDLAGNSQTLTGLADGGSSAGIITTSTGSSTLAINNSLPSSYGGAINDNNSLNGATLALLLEGSSNLTLSGSSNFTGGTNLTSGNLTVAGNYALGNPASTNPSAGLQLNPALSGTVNAYFTSANPNIAALNNPGAGTANVILGNTTGAGSATTLNIGAGDGGVSTFTGVISDQAPTVATAIGNLNVYGGGTLTLTATNTYKGTTTITGSNTQIILGNGNSIENSILNTSGGGALNLTQNSITTLTLGGLTGSVNFALVSGASPLALTVGNDNDSSSFSGNLSGPGSIGKTGTGTFMVTDATYTGGTVVYSGTMTISGSSNLTTHLDISGQTAVAGVVINGATVTSSNAIYITSSTGGTGTIYGNNANLTIINGAQVIANPDTTGRAISYGLGNGRPGGNGFLTIGAAGDTTTFVTANGTLDMFHTSGGGTVGNFAVNLLGGTLALDGILKTIGGTTQTSTFNFNGGVLESLAGDPTGSQFLPVLSGLTANVLTGGAIINTNGFTDTFVQPLVSGTTTDGGLTMNGAGTLILGGTNTYVGPTKVNAGNLVLSGSAGTGITKTASVSVAANANLEVDTAVNTAATTVVNGELSGNGGTVGPVTVTSTGTLAPGLSTVNPTAGNLTASGSVTLANTSVFSIGLGVATALDSDQLTISSGAVSLDDSTLSLTLGTAFSAATEGSGYIYVLINGGASATGSGSDVFSNAPASGSTVNFGGDNFQVLYAVTAAGAPGGSDVDLEYVGAVPEPGTWAEILAGFAVLGIWQRSRRKSRPSA